MLNLYNNYFAEDKPLRHYTQHLLVAFFGFFLLTKFGVDFSFQKVILFIIFSFIVDIDGLVSVFVFRKKIKEAGDIVQALSSYKFIESATLSTIHHKKLNRLVMHNLLGFIALFLILFISVVNDNEVLLISTWAIFCHFVFDIIDDVYQLGHINNWLWPLKHFFKLLKYNS